MKYYIELDYIKRGELEIEIYPILIQAENANYFIPSLWGKIIKRTFC